MYNIKSLTPQKALSETNNNEYLALSLKTLVSLSMMTIRTLWET